MSREATPRPEREHEFKTWPAYFEEVWTGAKPFEMRRDDRDVQTSDRVVLREWDPTSATYSGRRIRARVGYVLRASEVAPVPEGFCVFGLLDRRRDHDDKAKCPTCRCMLFPAERCRCCDGPDIVSWLEGA